MSEKTIILASPCGFCTGVDRVTSIVERAPEEFGASIYVRHEMVHNKPMVDNPREKGAIFTENLFEVPAGAASIYSAHGVFKVVREETEARGLRVFDATCPPVMRVHKEMAWLDAQNCGIIMIGHRGHVEVEGTMDQLPPDKMLLVGTVGDVARLGVESPDRLVYVSQTTFSVDGARDIIAVLNTRFPNIHNSYKEDICYVTTNRQKAVKELTGECDLVIMVGSPNSSNSNRLREVTALRSVDACMMDNAGYLRREWFGGKNKIGVTASASAPEALVKEMLQTIQEWGHETMCESEGTEESIVLVLPRELRCEGENKQALNKG